MIQGFPELVEIIETGKVPVFETANSRQGVLFEIPGIDLEANDSFLKLKYFQDLLRGLAEDCELKVHLDLRPSFQVLSDTFRSEAFRESGYFNRSIKLSIEGLVSDPLSLKSLRLFKKGTQPSHEREKFLGSIPWFELDQLRARALDRSQIEAIFALPNSSVKEKARVLDFGGHVLGVIHLYQQGVDPISRESVANVIQSLPLPCEIVVSAKKYRKVKAELKLRSLLGRQQAMTDVTSQERGGDLEEVLKTTLLKGNSIVDVQWVLILKRNSEEALRKDLDLALTHLASLGKVMIEAAGALPLYLASRFGSYQHFSFSELDDVASYFFPIASFGEEDGSLIAVSEVPKRSFLVHREDSSPHVFDLLNPCFTASNMIISGATGSGKSVFGNLLSSSVLLDPNIVLSKVDVGGSYSRECELYNGDEFSFSLDHPSGINPFRNLKNLSGSNDAIATLSTFLSLLIREEGEAAVPKMMRAALEENLKKYADYVKDTYADPNIDEFLKTDIDIPRRALLERWGKGGVFKNALRESESVKHSFNRYKYNNFENIVGASHSDFATGVMGAVITQVNLEMLRIAHDRHSKQRFIFFCDETKFFVEKNADFFLLTTANFRKFGHAAILMIQNIQDFFIHRDGQIDRGILVNSPTKVFFKNSMPVEFLKSEFNFTKREVQALVHEPYLGNDYREAVVMDDLGKRIVRLYLNPKELWRVTSTKAHTLKYEKLRSLIPDLTIEEAIRVLALGRELFQ